MSAAHSTTASALMLPVGTHTPTLSLPVQQIPLQQLRIGKTGDPVFMQAQWDKYHQVHVILEKEIERYYHGRKIHSVKLETGVIVTTLFDSDPLRTRPPRYRLCTDSILEVYFKEEPSPSPTASLPAIVNNVDQLIDQLYNAHRNGNWEEVQRLHKAIRQRYKDLAAEEHDAAQILSIKVLQLQLYPVPRRFYVLCQKDSLLCEKLQLHLLCECGIYDDDSISRPAQEKTVASQLDDIAFDATTETMRTHLSNHGGYLIKDYKPFCQDYGTYVLSVLRCLQFGLLIAGVVVPALTSVNITGWFTVMQSAANYNNPSWSDPYAKAMNFVASRCEAGTRQQLLETPSTETELPEPLDGPLYRQFKHLLQETLDRAGVYGGLTVAFCNRSGRLKWVCKDHVEPSVNGKSLLDSLETVVSAMKGVSLDRSTRELNIDLTTNNKADKKAMRALYKALIAAPGVKAATIQLGPSTSESEFDKIVKALGIANVPLITLDGDRVDKGSDSWYKRVLRLMVNKRCRALHLIGFPGFFDNSLDVDIERSYQLQSLHLDFSIDLDRHIAQLKNMLHHCPALKQLTIRSLYNSAHQMTIRSALPRLQHITMISPAFTAVVAMSKDDDDALTHTIEIQATDNGLPELHRPPHDHLAICPHLSVLRLDCSPRSQGFLEIWLANLVAVCPQLHLFDFNIALERFSTVVDSLGNPSNTQRILRLRSLPSEHKVTMVVDYGKNPPTIHSKVEMARSQGSNNDLKEILRSYGSHVQFLAANDLFDDALLNALLSSIESEGFSKLRQLAIDPTGLQNISSLQTAVEDSPDLKLTLSFSNLQESDRRVKALAIIALLGGHAEGLTLRGEGTSLDWISAIDLKRSQFQNLRHLKIALGDRLSIDGLAWTAVKLLISRPEPGTAAGVVVPLQSFSISNCDLSSARWKLLFQTLDFSTLQCLSVEDTNFGEVEMKTLIKTLPEPSIYQHVLERGTLAPLSELFLKGTVIADARNRRALNTLETRLLKIVPGMRIIID
ncbi:unnamed protein product [Mortierella alpina]